MTILAPQAARRRAQAAPIPELAPVISAVLPARQSAAKMPLIRTLAWSAGRQNEGRRLSVPSFLSVDPTLQDDPRRRACACPQRAAGALRSARDRNEARGCPCLPISG